MMNSNTLVDPTACAARRVTVSSAAETFLSTPFSKNLNHAIGSIDVLANNTPSNLSPLTNESALGAILTQFGKDSLPGNNDKEALIGNNVVVNSIINEADTTTTSSGTNKSKSSSSKSNPIEEDTDENNPKPQEATFPQQLMDAIEGETTNGTIVTSDGKRVLEWLPAGDAFIIRDKSKFESEVLPKHFVIKCKYMSFVRKLYRWGFRQVEKNLHGGMIFMHVHFLRTEKKRCLMMRSKVKKAPVAPQVSPPVLANNTNIWPVNIVNNNNNALQAFSGWNNNRPIMGGNNDIIMNTNNMMNAFAASQFTPQQAQAQMQTMFQNLNNQGQGGGGGDNTSFIMNSNNNGNTGPLNVSSLFTPKQFNHNDQSSSSSILGIAPTDMFQAGFQQQQQLQMMQPTSNNNNMIQGCTTTVPVPTLDSLPSIIMAKQQDTSNHQQNFGDDPELKLASEIMRCDPSIEPWKALELAKRFNSQQ